MNWQDTKPTEPGIYQVRRANSEHSTERVVVTRKGRGLSVYCAAIRDRAPMSQMIDGLQWAKEEAK